LAHGARPRRAPHLVGARRPRGRLPLAHRPPTEGLTMNITAFPALVRKDLVLYFSNRRALVMSVLAPIVIAAFFGAIFGSGMQKRSRFPIAFADRDGSALSKAVGAAVKGDTAFEVKEGEEAAVVALAREGKVRAAVVLPAGFGYDARRALLGGGARPVVAVH